MELPWWYPASMVGLSLVVAAAFVLAVAGTAPAALSRVALVVAAWLAVPAGLAASGLLSFGPPLPTMPLLLALLTAGTILFARSRTGAALATGLPLAALVGYQAFRIPVELWLHRGWVEGVFPVQMTYAGWNFDVVSGITAGVVALLVHAGVGGRRLVLAWNVLGLVLLATIVTIAILSAPLPFRVFESGPENTYVTAFPGVWLPAVLVQAALLGHLLVFRRLAATMSELAGPAEPAV